MTKSKANGLKNNKVGEDGWTPVSISSSFIKEENMLDFTILTNNLDTYLQGFGNTLKASLLALIFSFILGVIIAVMRISP